MAAPKQHKMTLNGMKIKPSGEKNQKLIGTDRVRRILDESTPCGHTNHKHALKDIELQRRLSEINNDTRKDANQRNKMRTYQ